jgi:hypothetical protein
MQRFASAPPVAGNAPGAIIGPRLCGGAPMPRSWSKKDERQYEHVKESELKRGRSGEKAEEIAARTVNKQRRSEGRTKNS